MDNAAAVLSMLGLIGAGLTGGTLFVFSNFLMRVLGAMPEEDGMRVMQAINRAVYNPWFMGGFVASTLIGVGSIVVGLIGLGEHWSIPLTIGGIMYVLGVFVVTAAGNVPLNNTLDHALHTEPEGLALWGQYLVVWTRWNHLRTGCSILSMAGFGISLWIL